MQIPAQNNEHVKHIQKKRAPHIGYGKKFTDSQIIKHNECWKFHAYSWISSFCYFQRLVYGLNRHVDIEFKKWFPRSLSPDNQWNRTIASDTSALLRWPRVSRSIPSTCVRNLWLGPLQKVPGMSLGWWCIGSHLIFFQILNTQDGLFSFPMTLWLWLFDWTKQNTKSLAHTVCSLVMFTPSVLQTAQTTRTRHPVILWL